MSMPITERARLLAKVGRGAPMRCAASLGYARSYVAQWATGQWDNPLVEAWFLGATGERRPTLRHEIRTAVVWGGGKPQN